MMRTFSKLGWSHDTQPFNFLRRAVQPCPFVGDVPVVVLDAPQVDFGSGTGGGARAIRGAFGAANGKKLCRWVRKFAPPKPPRRYRV